MTTKTTNNTIKLKRTGKLVLKCAVLAVIVIVFASVVPSATIEILHKAGLHVAAIDSFLQSLENVATVLLPFITPLIYVLIIYGFYKLVKWLRK